ncbi:MAG: cysteine peptidase family C39 domain-containing protein, partial [Clostridia bacterium]|nr:cysteine peptidase family C39 domain-containing protein [Clostridia bacterium]
MSKVVKTPVIMQLEALECGAACLTMILAYYDKWIPLEEVRVSCGVSRDGSNALNVIRAARHYGLDAKGYRFDDVASLQATATFPCIVHWNFNHFVVLNGFKGNKAYLNDPARGTYSIPIADFDDAFTGVCLMFEKGENFEPSGKPKSMVEFAKRRLKGSSSALIFTALVSTIAMLVAAIRPAFSRVFIDRLLSGTSPDWLVPFMLILAGFNIVQVIASAIFDVYALRINGKMAATSNATYMWKVLRMPIEFFTQRMAGDIQNRQASNETIANTLINVFAPLLLNGVMTIFYLVVMLCYSPWLTLIGLGSIIINLLLSRLISSKRVNITRVAARDVAKLSSATVAGIEMIETIKSSGAEEGYFARWAGFQASVNTAEVKLLKVNQYLGSIPQLVTTLANNFVLIIGVYLTMQGQFTVGMVMAFQGFLTSFMQPAATLITASQTIQEMRTQMERVDDVM